PCGRYRSPMSLLPQLLWLGFYVLCFLGASPQAASFEVQELRYEAKDTARGARRVVATLYLPSLGGADSQPAPAMAFAHGFGLGAGAYPLARELARRGLVVFLPHDLGVLPSTVNLALDQAFLLAHAVEQSAGNSSSLLFGRVANRTFLAGHSLGGGSTLLAADPTLASAYPAATAIATVSLGTFTMPNAMVSVPKLPRELPALLLTASEDCVDPPGKNTMPVFQSMQSNCAFVVSVVGGSHCQYAAESLGCTITEKLCGARPNITRERQTDVALEVLLPYLAAAEHGSETAWSAFAAVLDAAAGAGEVVLLGHRATSCGFQGVRPEAGAGVQSFASGRMGTDLLDAGFAVACQRQVAPVASAVELQVAELPADDKEFLVTKPVLFRDHNFLRCINVTVVSHAEGPVGPFSHSIAVKMKSASAIASGAADDVSCADLHSSSLKSALAALSDRERKAYAANGAQLQELRFGSDRAWHTGLWVPLARLEVTASSPQLGQRPALTVVSPRFFSSASLPAVGSMVYCRLLPPAAIRDWVRGQLADIAERGSMMTPLEVAKVSKKGAILSDLQIIREQIEEALRDFAASPHASVPCAGTARPAAALAPKKAVASSGKSKVAAVDPLPQRGKAPMPVNPRIVIEDGNSASRLAAYAPSSTVARSSMGYATVDEVQTRPLAAAAPLAARASAPLAARASARPKGGAGSVQALPPQSEQMAAVHETGRLLRLGPLHVGSSRPPPPPVPSRGQSAVAFPGEARRLPEEDDQSDGGFVQVKRGAKVGKKKGPVASGGGQDDDDAFW
ncbi:unnamed protein product, partial [Polarella glacialis]